MPTMNYKDAEHDKDPNHLLESYKYYAATYLFPKEFFKAFPNAINE